jgi:hypothetical protein
VGRGAAYISFGSRLCEVCRATQRTELGREDRVRRSGSYKVLSSHDVLLIRYNALQDSPRVVSRKRRNPAEWMISRGHGLVTPSQAWATQPRRSWQPPPPVCRQLLERPTATCRMTTTALRLMLPVPAAWLRPCVAASERLGDQVTIHTPVNVSIFPPLFVLFLFVPALTRSKPQVLTHFCGSGLICLALMWVRGTVPP